MIDNNGASCFARVMQPRIGTSFFAAPLILAATLVPADAAAQSASIDAATPIAAPSFTSMTVAPLPPSSPFGFVLAPPAPAAFVRPYSLPMSIDSESSEAPTRIRSPGMIVGGSALTLGGLVIGPLGFIVFASSTFVQCDVCGAADPADCPPCGSTGLQALGIVMMGAGLAGIGGGIAMIVLGAKRVPVGSGDVGISLGPTNFSVQGRF